MSDEVYPIPAGRHRIQLEGRRSRFIATVDHTPSVAAARQLIDQVRSEMPDATHHVYAFRVGSGTSVTCGMSDDGEPSGTAGRPALAVLEGSGLGDVCVVVTRYFGGTKLGTGGLVRAYSQATRVALETVPRHVHEPRARASLTLTYAQFEPVGRVLDAHRTDVVQSTFDAEVHLLLEVPAAEWEGLASDLAEATAGRAMLEPVEDVG